MNSYNPFSGLLNPLYIMKSFKTVTEEEILACMKPKTMKPKEIKKYYGTTSLLFAPCPARRP